MIVTE